MGEWKRAADNAKGIHYYVIDGYTVAVIACREKTLGTPAKYNWGSADYDNAMPQGQTGTLKDAKAQVESAYNILVV